MHAVLFSNPLTGMYWILQTPFYDFAKGLYDINKILYDVQTPYTTCLRTLQNMVRPKVATFSELGLNMTSYLEWRTSYRPGMPENFHAQEKRVRRLKKVGLLG